MLEYDSNSEPEGTNRVRIMDYAADRLLSVIPMAFLLAVIAIGYYLAWTDFKPKRIDADEDFHIAWKRKTESSPPKRPLSDSQLGLVQIDTVAALSPVEQRRLTMADRIRQYVQESPDEAANVLKGWLSDR